MGSEVECQRIFRMRSRTLTVFLLEAGEQFGMNELVFASGGDP